MKEPFLLEVILWMPRWDLATPNCMQRDGGKEWQTVFLSGRPIWKAETLIILVIASATVKAFSRTMLPLRLVPVSSSVKADLASATLLLAEHLAWYLCA